MIRDTEEAIIKEEKKANRIINKKYNFGRVIGGCEEVLEQIFGDILLSRLYPSTFINQTGIKHCRRILRHGPPGSRKTLFARTTCQALNVKPKAGWIQK
ncbi:unnamed protein product [Didymodactylos carnosus]|uniref:Vesicle-fusing ATPase n=1 Tax=Didymodactylos carnosus TaxID=1234261 RepID=A0A814J8H9_9BILA|nr:unnamed protein product [Didymodactylos carnosus]CAF1034025.1 unnamed protein product [Didymodactylos carnosus]CAF3597698.1 unnamed protein product [Didymodactylos carnosus]CAF3804720.1 unnamed protein product [Didymodactylos carnosus]